MKTLLFTLEYPPFKGGVANYYGNLAHYWPIDENLTVLDNSHEELMIREKGYFSWWPAIFGLRRKIKREKIDYVLVGQILPLGTVACLWSYFQPLKYAVFLHGMDLAYALKRPRKKWLTNLILKRADKIIAANSYVAEIVKEINPFWGNKTAVINPGIESGTPAVDLDEVKEIKNKYNLENKIVLFTLGRLIRRKGIDRTIQALVGIPEPLNKELIYFIAGTGPKKEFLKKLVPLKFSKKINFLGEISDEEKWAWFSLCDIFIMPSRDIQGDFEGFGIVYLEANLFGKPVIAGLSGGVKDAVVDGYNGLVVDSESKEEIRRGIITLATNKELRQKLGEQGRVRALADFNWEKQVAKIFNAINIKTIKASSPKKN
ncbi:MAG: glycosyltransferase family 4 protein [Patescibacteria group bacterium]|jgi:phosphatidylinositol alpha-1,6-mannosyltransferase